MPGLEVAPADPEAMGRGTGFRVKLLTGWEKPAAGGSSEGQTWLGQHLLPG